MSYYPLVSVLMPAYNHEKYVKEAIYSIVRQTYKNIELLIINDGSSDNTFEKIQTLKDVCQKRFTNFVCLNQENKGVSFTLHKMAKLAKGQYFYIIASDDIAEQNAIETLVREIENNNDYVLVVGDNAIIDSNSKRVGWDNERNTVEIEKAKYRTFKEFLNHNHKIAKDFSSDDFGSYESLLYDNYIPNGYLIKKEAYFRSGGYPKKALLEDFYLNLQLSKQGKFKFVDKILFNYRWHSSNSVRQSKRMHDLSVLTYIEEKNNVRNTKLEEIFLEKTKIYTKTFKIFKFLKVKKIKYKFGKEYNLFIFGKNIFSFKNFSTNHNP